MDVKIGDVLTVPFGAQQVGAIALRALDQQPSGLTDKQIRPVTAVISSGIFRPTYWQLLEKVSSYYQTALMATIRTALPPGLLGRSQRRVRLLTPPPADRDVDLPESAQCVLAQLRQAPQGHYSWQYLQQHCPGANQGIQYLRQQGWAEGYLALPRPPRPQQRQAVSVVAQPQPNDTDLTPRQQEVVALLQRQGGDLWLSDALQYCHTTRTTLKALAKKGYLVLEAREVLRRPHQPVLGADQPKPLMTDQQAALAALIAVQGYETLLLHGVTGSGKTEVYLQAIAPRLDQGQSALVLVPEIGLTPQLTDRFRQRFGERVCVYHSGLSDGERYDGWRQMLSGEPQVVIGTRSAVFAPLPNLGIVILDEEHDSSFKQDQPAPCYHARTVAQWRSQLDNCPLVLGSATPSLESWAAVKPTAHSPGEPKQALGQYLSLPQRVHARPLPPITVVDMRQELQAQNRSIFSRSLKAALAELSDHRGQGILFIHRRGHSRFVSCRSCGHVIMCPHCDVSLSHHLPHPQGRPQLRCHYCGFSQSQPPRCPECDSPFLKHFGSGTQRVEQALKDEFPDLRCLRFDSDTTRAKGAHRALLSRFAQGGADVLVGTQMLTKGIDLPQVTVVGIVAADGLLYMADYRASERAFQILTQVAGRAGRGEQPGRVILQTYTPDHPVVEAVKRQDVTAFIEAELTHRAELSYPPLGRLVLVRVSGADETQVEQVIQALAAIVQGDLNDQWQILGPAPAPVLRVARRYRWQMLLKGTQTAPLPDLTELTSRCPTQVSVTVDIDPLNM
jgi:primosomal protein N' (replication factor Y)